jgi:integrase
VLADDELRDIWLAAATSRGAFGAIVRMLILTGQRRNEVAGMAWPEIAADGATWTIPASRTKNGVLHIVPLPIAAQQILATEAKSAAGLIVSATGARFSGWSHAKARLDAKSGVASWTLHDLRRTFATGLQRLGVRLEVTEAALNHVSGSKAGIVGIYQRHTWTTEKQLALQAWSEHVAAIIEDCIPRSGQNVVRLNERLAK